MEAAFERAHAFTAKWEGGLSDHASDPGGITKYGVSLRWLKDLEEEALREYKRSAATCDGSNAWDSPHDFNHDGRVDREDIKAITRVQATALFQKHFWKPLGCAQLPTGLGAALYDCAVNTGSTRAVKLLQLACNVVGEAHLEEFCPLKEDGRMGPLTRAMAKDLAAIGLDFYTARFFVRERQLFYVRLAKQKPDLAVFLPGWKNRCADLLEHLALWEREV